MRRYCSKMHMRVAKDMKIRCRKFLRMGNNFLRNHGFERAGENCGATLLQNSHFWQNRPEVGTHSRKSEPYLPMLDQSVSSAGTPFLTMVGYTLSKPLWSEAL